MTELFERAKTHLHRSEFEPAIAALSQHLNMAPGDDIALWMLASAYIETNRYGLAQALLRSAIATRRGRSDQVFTDALASLGVTFFQQGNIDEAEKLFLIALEHEGDQVSRSDILSNLGKCFTNAGNPQKALSYLKRALAERPDNDGARFSSHFAHLELGNWKEGWEASEARFDVGQTQRRQYRNLPEWDGTPGQRVIVWGEQGIGDEILFASCLPDLIKVSEKVIFDCHPRLLKLFERSFPEVTFHPTRKQLSALAWLDTVEADASISVASLPRFFRKTDEDFPGTPFLIAHDSCGWRIEGGSHVVQRSHAMHELRKARGEPAHEVPGGDGRPRIGISWTGGTPKTYQHRRSIPLLAFEPILRAVDADFYSLQYTPEAAKDVCALEEKTGLHVKHYADWVQCQDYDKTASFVASLDLVITCGTSVHHLSNALGVPTWTLVPTKAGWRYASKGTVWYRSTARFFRQYGDDWRPAIEEIAGALKARFA